MTLYKRLKYSNLFSFFLHDNHQKLRNALLKSKFVSADSNVPELTWTNSEYLYCSLLGHCKLMH